MNFFKLFSWKNRAEQQELQVLAAMRADSKSARPLHYIFAHRLLPQLAFHHGLTAALTLGDPTTQSQYLPRLWEVAAQHLPPEDFIEPTGLTGETHRVGEFRITIVTCPPPKGMPEVYFAAIVCGPLSEADEGPFRERAKSPVAQILNPPGKYSQLRDAFSSHHMLLSRPAPTQYYTLELGETETYEKRTVFCAWTPGGQHLNFGDGCEPTPEAFLALVASSLSQKPVLYGSATPEGVRRPDGTIISEEEIKALEKQIADENTKPRW